MAEDEDRLAQIERGLARLQQVVGDGFLGVDKQLEFDRREQERLYQHLQHGMATHTEHLHGRLDDLHPRFTDLQARLTGVEGRLGTMESRIETRLQAIENEWTPASWGLRAA